MAFSRKLFSQKNFIVEAPPSSEYASDNVL